MALPQFPNTPTVGQIHTINTLNWRCRSISPTVWEPLSFSPQQMYISPEMYGAVGNGTTDDTTALQNFFAATGKTKVMRPGATYLVSGRLNITGQQDVMVYGNGARILRNQTDGMYPGQPNNPNTGYVNPGIDQHILVVLNSKNITIDGLRIRGGYNPASPQTPGINTSYWSNSQTNGRGEDGHGISICQSEDVIIQNCEIVNVWGDCVWVTSGGYLGDPSHTPNRNIVVRNCDLRNPFRGLLSSVHHINLVFENNYGEKYTGYTTAVLLEPNNNVAQNTINTQVKGNILSAGLSGLFAATSAGALLNGEFIYNIQITDNYLAGSAGLAFTSPNVTGVEVAGNTYTNSGLISNSSQYGLFLEAFQLRQAKFSNNRDWSGGTSSSYYNGYRLEQCSDITFNNHTISPLFDKSNVVYFTLISTTSFRLLNSFIKGRDTSDPNGTGIIQLFGTSSDCSVKGNRIDGTGTTMGLVYQETSGYTGSRNLFEDNTVTSSSSSFVVSLKTDYFGTVVGNNIYTSGRSNNVTGGTLQSYQHPTALVAGVIYAYGTAAPTTGSWVIGSRVYNTASGATDYWDCTVSGTPGTWVARN